MKETTCVWIAENLNNSAIVSFEAKIRKVRELIV